MSCRSNTQRAMSVFFSATLLLISTATATVASVNISGKAFDIAVLDDPGNTAQPTDYSATQTGGTVFLDGLRPGSGANASYFLSATAQGDVSEFICELDFQSLSNSQSYAGLAFRAMQDGSASDGPAAEYRLVVGANRTVSIETRLGVSSSSTTHYYTLNAAVQKLYLKGRLDEGRLGFFLAKSISPGQPGTWLSLGQPAYMAQNFSFGMLLRPNETSTFERAVFREVRITTRVPGNGLAKSSMRTAEAYSGLSDWKVASLLPGTFHDTPLPFIKDIKDAYVGGRFADTYQQKLFESMTTLLTQTPVAIDGSEEERRGFKRALPTRKSIWQTSSIPMSRVRL